MKVTDPDKKWFDELIVELRMRDVLGHAIGDTVASARELLEDTGQRADEAFGPARSYAASLELPRESGPGWASRGLWPSILGLVAFLMFLQAGTAVVEGEFLLISPEVLALLAGPVILVAFLPLYLESLMRRPWLIVVLTVICGVLGFLTATVVPATPDEAWLVLDPLPWLVGSGVAMLLSSIWGTIGTLRRGTVYDVVAPVPVKSTPSIRATRVITMVSNWLFPIGAALLTLLLLVTR